jgi:hypothetical protein
LDEAAQVLLALQQPEHTPIGELADGRFVQGRLIGSGHNLSIHSTGILGAFVSGSNSL